MFWCLVLVFVASASAQFQCPKRTGFFPDPEECDIYYVCSRGTYEEKLCPDGLVFDDRDPNEERCVIPANVDCRDRSILQEPKPSEGCPRANGYYPHSDPSKCDKFYNCIDGDPREMSCPPGLVFDPKKAICTWLTDDRRKVCFKSQKEELDDGFKCGGEEVRDSTGRRIPHPTFPHPEDCSKFYICRNGVSPSKGSCSPGTVYNEDSFTCDDPKNVPGCENYYSKKN